MRDYDPGVLVLRLADRVGAAELRRLADQMDREAQSARRFMQEAEASRRWPRKRWAESVAARHRGALVAYSASAEWCRFRARELEDNRG